jgi:hypothetical protein
VGPTLLAPDRDSKIYQGMLRFSSRILRSFLEKFYI